MRVIELLGEGATSLPTQLYAPHPRSPDYPKTVKENLMKPTARLWTSTARQTARGYTSAWVEWCKSEMPGWVGKIGFLLQVSGQPRILTLRSDQDALRVAKKYGQDLKSVEQMFFSMPWQAISQDFDAIRYVPSGHDFFMGTWDVESTAWFDTKFLQNKQQVKIDKSK